MPVSVPRLGHTPGTRARRSNRRSGRSGGAR